MLLNFGKKNKMVKELRKNQGLTAKELARMVKVDTIKILRVEDVKLKDVPEPLKSKISPILTGKYMDKIPW
ncbi:MAG: transcriptional regulator [Firmicutes bacterium]|nr:transcriptional regulator [Bacillota bacterium]